MLLLPSMNMTYSPIIMCVDPENEDKVLLYTALFSYIISTNSSIPWTI